MTRRFKWDDEPDRPLSTRDPPRVSKRDLARLTGLPVARFEALMRQGLPNHPGLTSRAAIMFDLGEVIRWLIEVAEEEADPIAPARKRKAEAEAKRLELANARSESEFYRRDDVHKVVDETMVELRADLLAIPAALVDQPADVQDAVRAAIVERINSRTLNFEETNGRR